MTLHNSSRQISRERNLHTLTYIHSADYVEENSLKISFYIYNYWNFYISRCVWWCAKTFYNQVVLCYSYQEHKTNTERSMGLRENITCWSLFNNNNNNTDYYMEIMWICS